MTENSLDLSEINAQFEQVGRIGMTQAVQHYLVPDSRIADGSLECLLDTSAIHRAGRPSHPFESILRVWKQQPGISVDRPELAQYLQRRHGWRDVAVLAAFGIADMDPLMGGIDVPHFQSQSFPQTQPHAVQCQEADTIAKLAGCIDDLQGFFTRQDIRDSLDLGWLDDAEPLPPFVQYMTIEELQTITVELDDTPGVGFNQGPDFLCRLVWIARSSAPGPWGRALLLHLKLDRGHMIQQV